LGNPFLRLGLFRKYRVVIIMSNSSYQHRDTLAFLNQGGSLKEKLVAIHHVVQRNFLFVARIAVTLYDPETKVLKTYLHSSGSDNPIANYQTLLDNAPSLKEILRRGQPRVINDMLCLKAGKQLHTKQLDRQKYAASYTLPIFNNSHFIGFIFFNSYQKNVFSTQVLESLDLYGHLIAFIAINELAALRTLTAAVKTTGQMTHFRDPETGVHLDRMSRYSLLIARALADKYELNDEYIEHVFMFSPLHDIGKIGIPDSILLKPGLLTEAEMHIMKTHASKGREMIDDLLANFGLENLAHVNVLRNIAVCHHEAVNGSGYPYGKVGDEIPLEARIVAVADIFDALTSKRPYKEAWSNEVAFTTLQRMAGEQLDQDCVAALIDNKKEITCIQQRFQEEASFL